MARSVATNTVVELSELLTLCGLDTPCFLPRRDRTGDLSSLPSRAAWMAAAAWSYRPTPVDYLRCISGEHPDWDEYRASMRMQDKSLIRVTPTLEGQVRCARAFRARTVNRHAEI